MWHFWPSEIEPNVMDEILRWDIFDDGNNDAGGSYLAPYRNCGLDSIPSIQVWSLEKWSTNFEQYY